MKINDIFSSIQGEGRFTGTPALFIRTSGCNLKCLWCDTKHQDSINITIEELLQSIDGNKLNVVVWTGGEPMLQREEIIDLIRVTSEKMHHLETNGTILCKELSLFDYVCISPKNKNTAKKIKSYFKNKLHYTNYDIKIVTDLNKIGTDLIEYATILMPLTTGDKRKDLKIEQNVWDYCVKNNIKYSPRLQINLRRK